MVSREEDGCGWQERLGCLLGEREFKDILGRFSVGWGRSRDRDTVPEKVGYLGEEKEMIIKAGSFSYSRDSQNGLPGLDGFEGFTFGGDEANQEELPLPSSGGRQLLVEGNLWRR